MSELLKAGQTIQTDTGSTCQVERFLGSGGQGEVYRVNWSGQPFALKWYFPHMATSTQLQNLRTLVTKGAPTQQFLWPLELASQSGLPGYGYLMRLREPQYKGILDLMKRKVEPTFKTLATAGLQLADCYLQLHARGFCYCDISFGNVFWNSQTGDVLICDNDNVIVNGEKPEIVGTARFMAPEVVTASALPSIDTDKYSLAVLLFYMFTLHHPLEGKRDSAIKCFDKPGMKKLFGTEPIFIFDPRDDSNRPDGRYHGVVNNFWPIYPQFLRDRFTKAFTNGLRDPKHGRVTENEWKAAMAQMRDSILYCQKCAAENFYDPDALKAAGGKSPRCWSCCTDVNLPFRIRIGKAVTMLNHDSCLYPHHVDDEKLYDFSQPIAEVTRHPKDPNLWGLKNRGREKWVVTVADGSFKDVEPGRSVALARGTRINFGKVEGEIGY
jgi:DNA-binding helix-hairpin-helix protein with protein kinase domain